MVKITIDGINYEVKPGKNLLETCLSLGINVPHFCYHPALGSVGACRLCAVKKFFDVNDRKGRIVMSCMEPVVDGLIVSVEDPDARSFRASVIESLMINHPHDCPVCDEGGECHLQDMTIMTGHTYRRYDFPKRTYKNQQLGPFINHEMNRCIQCYRCVRYYCDYAGGKDLNVFASRNQVYFGRHKDGDLENVFSGNLVEVCPTGVFTDKTLKKNFTRKWDLSNSPSVCVHCSVGCNIIASERYGSLRRIMNRYNGAVNGYFICDRGRFGYEFVNGEKRIRDAEYRPDRDSKKVIVPPGEIISGIKTGSKERNLIGIGSPRATLETNFALMTLVGSDNFYHGITEREFNFTKTIADYYQNSGVRIPSLKEIEKADAILILGEDLTNTAPMIALAVRQAARNHPNEEAVKNHIPLWNDIPVRQLGQDIKSSVFIATPFFDALDDTAEGTFRGSFREIAELGNAVRSNIEGKPGSSKKGNEDQQQLSEKIALSLKKAKHPLIISGVNCLDQEVIHMALNITTVLRNAGSEVMLTIALPECNSLGLALLPGRSFETLFSSEKKIDRIIIAENDLYRRAAEESVEKLLNRSVGVIVIDHVFNKTAQKADILLPAATFAESEGTLINNEGRAQRYYKSLNNKDGVKESWRWIVELMNAGFGNKSVTWDRVDDVLESIAGELKVFLKLRNYEPDADFRMLNTKIPRQTIRYSGRTAMTANIQVSETNPPQDEDSPLAFSMEGQNEEPPSSLIPFYWTPGWNSVQALYRKYTEESESSLKGGDPGIRLFESEGGTGSISMSPGNHDPELLKGEFVIVPYYQIFGSEELSSLSPAVIQKIKEPFLLINQEDAANLQFSDGELVKLEISEVRISVRVKTGTDIKQGMAALSVNLPGMPFIALPGKGRFHKL